MAKYIVYHGIKVARDFVPQTFGRLTTLGPKFQVGDYHTAQVCECVCGEIVVPRVKSLVTGHTISCGCYLKERIRETHTKHGHYKNNEDGAATKSPEYEAYYAMLARCYNPKNTAYSRYGALGIGVWGDWRGVGGFERWYAHIGPKPSPDMTQDRYPNPNGNYEPGNVRWATHAEQVNNAKSNIVLTHEGETMTLAQWAAELGIVYETLYTRYRDGWTIEKMLTTPTRKIRKKDSGA